MCITSWHNSRHARRCAASAPSPLFGSRRVPTPGRLPASQRTTLGDVPAIVASMSSGRCERRCPRLIPAPRAPPRRCRRRPSTGAAQRRSAISTRGSPRRRSSHAGAKLFDRISLRRVFDVLPTVSHRTCGGGPRCSSKRTKSLSLVNTTAFASRAARKISRSPASRNPRSRAGRASMPNSEEIHRAR